jgi:hypothetical protein
VPTGEHHELRSDSHPLGALSGRSRPFTEAELRDRYPSAGSYINAYGEAVDRAVAEGFLRGGEASTMKAEAAETAAALISW